MIVAAVLLIRDAFLVAYGDVDALYFFVFEEASHRAVLLLVHVDVDAWDVVRLPLCSQILEDDLLDWLLVPGRRNVRRYQIV